MLAPHGDCAHVRFRLQLRPSTPATPVTSRIAVQTVEGTVNAPILWPQKPYLPTRGLSSDRSACCSSRMRLVTLSGAAYSWTIPRGNSFAPMAGACETVRIAGTSTLTTSEDVPAGARKANHTPKIPCE